MWLYVFEKIKGDNYFNNIADVYIEILDDFLIPQSEIGLVFMKSFLRTIMHLATEQKGLKFFFSGKAYKINDMASEKPGSKSN